MFNIKNTEKQNFGLSELKSQMVTKSEDFLKEVQSEIVQEEQDMLKDLVKGAYRLKVEKQNEIERIDREIKDLDLAIEQATGGNWEPLGKIRIPVRLFKEEALRKHNKSILDGTSEIRFMDFYLPEK